MKTTPKEPASDSSQFIHGLYLKRWHHDDEKGEYVAMITLPEGMPLSQVIEIGVAFRREFNVDVFGTVHELAS